MFSLVIFGCIVTNGYQRPPGSSEPKCIFNQNGAVCRYAVALGVLGFVACILFLGLDVSKPHMTASRTQMLVAKADLSFSLLWTVLWFIGFCVLTAQWNRSPAALLPAGQGNARAIIVFSFFSVLCWGTLLCFAVLRFKKGFPDSQLRYSDSYMDADPDVVSTDGGVLTSHLNAEMSGFQNLTLSLQRPEPTHK
nr:PREDICTED: synaptogyrin-4 isoform X2 [Latimeria chalumnae]|eukprot:XP_014352314.1 PREDICTED: synaptogyrin-4 isoform X2 [Latimeria chalumnae]